MMLASIAAVPLSIPFNTAFKHATAERSVTHALWVEARARDGRVGYGEGCPRDYVTGEDQHSVQAFIAEHRDDWLNDIADIDTLTAWVADHRSAIDHNPAAWTAVELALLDLLGKTVGRPVESLLGQPLLSGNFHYTAVLGDGPIRQFEAQLGRYQQLGFTQFKIKLSGDRMRDAEKIAALVAAAIAPQAVRADANNLWRDSDTALRDLEALDFAFFAVEEPLPAGDYQGMQHIATAFATRIILDESLLRLDQLERYSAPAQHWIVNLRISKMGGLIRSLELAQAMRQCGLPMIVGAHVGETSLLTRAALAVANSARDILIAQEGAFGTYLLARDVVAAPLMFGPAGVLDSTGLEFDTAPGLGLAISLPPND